MSSRGEGRFNDRRAIILIVQRQPGANTIETVDRIKAELPRLKAAVPAGLVKTISVEHPTGEFSVELEVDPSDPQNVKRAALLRTARLIMRGEVMVPASAWNGEAA